MHIITATVTTPADLESLVNEAVANGLRVTVNGKTVIHDILNPRPVHIWGTGSASVNVATKNGRGKHLLWMKQDGPAATVTIAE